MRDYLDAHPMLAAGKRRAIEKWLRGYERTVGANGEGTTSVEPRAQVSSPAMSSKLAWWAIGISIATAVSQLVEWIA